MSMRRQSCVVQDSREAACQRVCGVVRRAQRILQPVFRTPASKNTKKRGPDIRKFVWNLEEWVIRALASFNVTGERREGRVGIWVDRGAGREDKIAAIGVRIRKWVAFHGISINVDPDLSHFTGIVPCGIQDHGVTSLVDLGLPVTMADLDTALIANFPKVFGD